MRQTTPVNEVHDNNNKARKKQIDKQTFWGLEDESGRSWFAEVVLCNNLDLVLRDRLQTVKQLSGDWSMCIIINVDQVSPVLQCFLCLTIHLNQQHVLT